MDTTVLPKRSCLCRPNDSTSTQTLLFPFQACPFGPSENDAYRDDTFPVQRLAFGQQSAPMPPVPLPLAALSARFLSCAPAPPPSPPSPVEPTQLCTLLLSLTFLHWLAGKSIRGGRGIKQEAEATGGRKRRREGCKGSEGAREDKKGGGTLKEKSGEAMLMLRDAGLALKRSRLLPIRLGEMRRGGGSGWGTRRTEQRPRLRAHPPFPSASLPQPSAQPSRKPYCKPTLEGKTASSNSGERLRLPVCRSSPQRFVSFVGRWPSQSWGERGAPADLREGGILGCIASFLPSKVG